ncbi:MAG: DUF362 domain-containing protein [Clostridia bacterium]|nr:DUF362 domain-containing protein [Clostridia bacterium]
MSKSKVYFTKDISSGGLMKIYKALGVELEGNVAVKISTGEMGGHYYLSPHLIEPLVSKLKGTIVENNTAYPGKRERASDHWQVIKAHGFSDIAPCDILDEDGEMPLEVKDSKHLKGVNYVGDRLKKYESMLVLSHFKGHMMGGFGGALKNLSIGVASRSGKAWIHSWGNTKNPKDCWTFAENQNAFLESMAEACEGVINYFTPSRLAYINVANNISIDCDCDSNPHAPEMADIGIFASLDPVALDRACVDAVFNSKDEGKASLIKRIKERNGEHILTTAHKLGLGSLEYEIVDIDK